MRYVYCHPLFDERKCAHRFSYQLHCAFEKAGFEFERFDYYGTGEEEGDFENVTLDLLQHSINAHIQMDNVCLIGLRLGASLAFDCFVHNYTSVKKIILLEPIIHGIEYIDHLYRKQHIKDILTGTGPKILNQRNFVNIEGYKTNTQLIEQVKKIHISELIMESNEISGTVYLGCLSNNTNSSSEITKFVNLLQEKKRLNFTVEYIELPRFWQHISNSDYSKLIDKILEWANE
jgi:hypothetical protein